MRLQDMTFDLDKARVDAAYVGNICLTYEEWPETDNDMQYILAAVYDLEPALDEIERQAARIKELEADRIAYRNLGSKIEELETHIERLEAAFLEAKRCPTCNGKGMIRHTVMHRVKDRMEDMSFNQTCPLCSGKGEQKAREALEEIKNGMEN